MARLKSSRQETDSDAHPRRSRRGLVLAAGLSLLLVGAAVLLARYAPPWWARRTAAELLETGAVSEARDWLAWSSQFESNDGRRDLLLARCHRYWQQREPFEEALKSAQENGAPPQWIERESQLGRISFGEVPADPEAKLGELLVAGASISDVCGAFVFGCLYMGDSQKASGLLDRWTTLYPDDANADYVQGVYWRSTGNLEAALEYFQKAVDRQPRHELAREKLAELLERNMAMQQALTHRIELAAGNPSSEPARRNLAKTLRKMGRASDARRVLAPLASRTDLAPETILELANVALQLGDSDEALRRFSQWGMDPTIRAHSVMTQAGTAALQGNQPEAQSLFGTVEGYGTALSLTGETLAADQIFDQISGLYDRLQRLNYLAARLTMNRNDASASAELAKLTSMPLVRPPADPSAGPTELGPKLFAQHCAVCHGDNGDGNGQAARHLYPRPKNLRLGGYRLISTLSGIPSRQDLEATIRRGMPGSSMPPFDTLHDDEITALADEVRRLYREGIRDAVVASLSVDGEEVDEDEVAEMVEELTTPGEPAEVPPLGEPNVESIARGREIYDRMGCIHCHGPDGAGPSDTLLVDDQDRLTSSRNLAREPLKGGDEPEAVYLRILLGMPGTPHPASTGLNDGEMADLVHFVLSLRGEPLNLTNHDRLIRGLQQDPRAALAAAASEQTISASE